MKYHQSGFYPFKIKSYECDLKGQLSLPSSFLFLQESAWQNALENGFGFEYLEKDNAYWVLTRVLIQFNKWPKWKDIIKVKTWPRVAEGLFAMRDYQIFSDDKILASASSSWLIIDKHTKRPRRIADFDFGTREYNSNKALNKTLVKIDIPTEMAQVDQRKVYVSDIDVNGHVNNATYVKWIADAHYYQSKNSINEFEINFISELMLEDGFIIKFQCLKGVYFYQILNSNLKEICRARIL